MTEKKPSRITNKHYKEFLDSGIISTLNREDLNKVLDNIDHKYSYVAKQLVKLLFFTGCRPKEALMLRPMDFSKEKGYVKIKVPGLKRGLTRTIYLSLKDLDVKELYEWSQKHYPELLLFWSFISDKKRTNIKAKLKDGTIKTYTTEYHDTTNKLYYSFKKWFSVLNSESYTPYFLRHNCFSRLSEGGANMEAIMQLKGARSIESVRPYLHMSSAQAKKNSKLLLN